MYNGPFSTTIAQSIAKKFCNDQGLIFTIQPSYDNPLRFCIGINMTAISAFKNEQEVLLYNEYLPIQKAQTFDNDPIILMDHLLFSLLSRKSPINKINAFYNQLGVTFDDEWIPAIVVHEQLFEPTKCGDLRIIDRLSKELGVTFFTILLAMREFGTIDENNNLILPLLDHDNKIDTEQFTFAVGFGSDLRAKPMEFKFVNSDEIMIPCEAAGEITSDSWAFNVYCKSCDDTYPFTQIHSMMLPLYVFQRRSMLTIGEHICAPSLRSRGAAKTRDFCVRSFSNINITKTAGISCAVGLCIISNGFFSNKGIINNGYKKNIFIICDVFNNMRGGVVECADNGTIHIFARKCNNHGVMKPEPQVTYSSSNSAEQWSGDLPLSIVDFVMHILRTEQTTIDPNWFHKNYGFRIKPSWYQHIIDHPLLLAVSDKMRRNAQYRIIDRLANEMNIKFFRFFLQIHDKLHFDYGTSIRLSRMSNVATEKDNVRVSKWEIYNCLKYEEEIYGLGVVQEKRLGGRLGKECIMVITSKERVLFIDLHKMEVLRDCVLSASEIVSTDAENEDTFKVQLSSNELANKSYKCHGVTATQWRAVFVAAFQHFSNKTADSILKPNNSRFKSIPIIKAPSSDILAEYTLSTSDSLTYPIDDVSKVEIPIDPHEIAPVDIYANPVGNSSVHIAPIRIKTVIKKRFIFENIMPLHIQNSIQIPPRDLQTGQGGSLEIKSLSDIIIEKNVVITGSPYKNGAAGSSIKLFCGGNVKNNGILRCSGGLIHITAETFRNDGVLECNSIDANGRIHIICREYRNNGRINPKPLVVTVPKETVQWPLRLVQDYTDFDESLFEFEVVIATRSGFDSFMRYLTKHKKQHYLRVKYFMIA